MRLLRPLRYDPSAPLARAHPLAKLAATLLVMLALFLVLDPVTPAIVLAALLAALPLWGVDPRALALRAVPLLIAAAGIGVFNALVSGDAVAGLSIALRLIAISLSGVISVATIEPTDLADALVEHLHASPRFAIGALAAVRLAPIFAQEWDRIALARRARGIETERTWGARVLSFPARTHALLVGAIRRATALALAMDARGFGTRPCRTITRPRPFAVRDGALVAAAAALVVAAVASSAATGAWRPAFGG